MSEENQVDPILQENLSDVSVNDPLLPKNDYEVEVVKVTQRRTQDDTGNLLSIEMKLCNETTAVTGEPIPAGRRLFHNISLSPTPNYPLSSIQRNLKRFMLCFVPNYEGGMFPLPQWAGLRGVVTAGPSKTTDRYPEPRSEVKAFKPKRADVV